MSYRHLGVHERMAMFYLRQMGRSFRAIWCHHGRSHTAILWTKSEDAPRFFCRQSTNPSWRHLLGLLVAHQRIKVK